MPIGTPGFEPGRLTEARAARRIPSMSALGAGDELEPQHCVTLGGWKLGTRFGRRWPVWLRSWGCGQNFSSGLSMFQRGRCSSARFRPRWSAIFNTRARRCAGCKRSATRRRALCRPACVDIPDVTAGANYHQLRDEDLDRIALDLRRHWRLGDGPSGDMVPLLERFGFVVGVIEMGTVKLDGLCSWSPVDAGRISCSRVTRCPLHAGRWMPRMKWRTQFS